MSVNGFSDVDLRNTPTSVLQSDLTKTQAAIDARLQGTATSAEAVEEYTINGRAEKRTPLQFLLEYRSAIYRALQLQASEPGGIGIAFGRLGNASGRPMRRGGF